MPPGCASQGSTELREKMHATVPTTRTWT